MIRGDYIAGNYDVKQLRLEKYRWVQIAKKLECTRRQLEYWRERGVGFVDPRHSITDAELDVLVYDIQQHQPQRGDRTALSALPLTALVSRAQHAGLFQEWT